MLCDGMLHFASVDVRLYYQMTISLFVEAMQLYLVHAIRQFYSQDLPSSNLHQSPNHPLLKSRFFLMFACIMFFGSLSPAP